ncbi:D-alanine--D-alanine ligase [Parasalinivibrio latis]|uniref:D-alanine--D-alanine ligase n=1 Tax=Parasalinivibrio latis TaxID=2952610 RepID=UPI003DA64B0F
MPEMHTDGPDLSWFEFMPAWVMYTPVVIQSIIMAIRYRSLTLPLAANPGIHLSGMVGESKTAILSLARGKARDYILPFITLNRSRERSTEAFSRSKERLIASGLNYPVVAKPDMGCRGAGVRLIKNDSDLQRYMEDFPKEQDFLLQEKAPWSAEVGIFYTRYPDSSRGKIISMGFKYIPFVVGDGVTTLRGLIESDSRAEKLSHIYFSRFENRLDEVLPDGEVLNLVFSGSHSKGAIFRNGNEYITEALTRKLDEVLADVPGFFFGRLDVKFRTITSLMAGKDFTIIELNGASSESVHIWDNKSTYVGAVKMLLKQYRILYEIGDQQRKAGHNVPTLSELFKAWRQERALTVKYPSTD